MQDSTLRVSEFFCSIQGEGISAGARCLFVRLATCNLRCSFCDTPYSWDFTRYDSDQEVQKLEIGELARRIAGAAEGRLVLTGGEPLIQQDGLVRLVALLPERLIIEVETNGTLAPCPELLARVDQWNVSPKLSNSGEPQRRRLLPAVLARFAASGRAWLKLVVGSSQDCQEAAELVQSLGWPPERVLLMPEARSRTQLGERAPLVREAARALGLGFSPRLHLELYDGARGR